MKQSEQQLRDEIVLREASLADAQRELAAGELSAIQAASIQAREELALLKAREALDEILSGAQHRSPRRRRRSLLLIGLGCLFAVVVIVLWSSIVLRQDGASITGNVTLSTSQHVTQLLDEAESDVATGNDVAAVSAYKQVLALSPSNVAALTQLGWLEFSAGSSSTNPTLVQLGITDLRKAIAASPKNAAARLYYAIVADSTPNNVALAKSQFRVFLALHPSTSQLAVARPFLDQLGLPTS